MKNMVFLMSIKILNIKQLLPKNFILMDVSCEGMLGPNLVKYLNTAFDCIVIAAIIMIIVLSSIDFAKAVAGDKPEDSRKKAITVLLKRLAIGAAILFLPLLLRFLLSFINNQTIDPSMCGID